MFANNIGKRGSKYWCISETSWYDLKSGGHSFGFISRGIVNAEGQWEWHCPEDDPLTATPSCFPYRAEVRQ